MGKIPININKRRLSNLTRELFEIALNDYRASVIVECIIATDIFDDVDYVVDLILDIFENLYDQEYRHYTITFLRFTDRMTVEQIAMWLEKVEKKPVTVGDVRTRLNRAKNRIVNDVRAKHQELSK